MFQPLEFPRQVFSLAKFSLNESGECAVEFTYVIVDVGNAPVDIFPARFEIF